MKAVPIGLHGGADHEHEQGEADNAEVAPGLENLVVRGVGP